MKEKNKLSILSFIIVLSMILTTSAVFAATFHVQTTGGSKIETVGTQNDKYVSSLVNITNPNYDESTTTVTGSGWLSGTAIDLGDPSLTYSVYYKAISNGNADTDFIIHYPKYLKVGDKYYDVDYKLTSTAFNGTKCNYSVRKGTMNTQEGANIQGVTISDEQKAGSKEIGWTVNIYEAGTNTPAKIKNIHFGIFDLDKTDLTTEVVRVLNFTPSTSNTWFESDAKSKVMVNSNNFYGVELNDRDANVFIKHDTLSNNGTISGYYAWIVNGNGIGNGGFSPFFYVTRHTVKYTTDGHGTVPLDSEKKFEDENPTGTTETPDQGYYFTHWKVDKAVELKDGTQIPAGSIITDDQIKDVVVKEDLTFTAYNLPYLKVEYEWVGDHPNKVVPEGKTDIKKGDTYTVNDDYKPGDTVNEPKDGVPGIWTFENWDQTGDLTINENTVIKGTWNFTPYYEITTEVVNGTITDTEKNIPPGENRVITYTPDEGYQLVSLTVDGEDKNINEYPVSYPFENINADHHVKAVFERIPVLAIEKTADKEVYTAGDTVTYTIVVKQTVEGAEARDVVIEDTLPDGLSLVADSFEFADTTITPTVNENSYNFTIANLANEFTYTYKAVTAKDISSDELINVVQATASNVPGEPVKDDAKIKSLIPKPEITKIVSNENPVFGEEITYTISVKEPQDGISIKNAVVKDVIPEGVELVPDTITITGDPGELTTTSSKSEDAVNDDGQNINISIPELATETVITFKAKVTAHEGKIINIATLNGDDIDEVSAEAPIKVQEPNPVLKKVVNKEKVLVGDTVTYTITASSDVTLINAKIEDDIPEGVEIIKDSVKCEKGNASIEDNVLTATFETLNEEVTISYNAKITSDGDHVNTAELTADNYPKGPLTDNAKVVAVEDSIDLDDPTNPVDPDKPSDLDNPSNPEKTTTSKSNKSILPRTGDSTNIMLAIILLFAAASTLTGYYVYRKRRK